MPAPVILTNAESEFKTFHSSIKSVNEKERTIEHFISTEAVDRVKDIMHADGMQITGKVVVLFQHGQDPVKGAEPIAKMISLRPGVNEKGVKGIIAVTKFPDDAEGLRLFNKVKDDTIPNWSICFRTLEYDPTPEGGRIVTKWELLEYSLVSVACNPHCTNKSSPDCKHDGTCKGCTGDKDIIKVTIEKEIPPADPLANIPEEKRMKPNTGEGHEQFMKRCIPEMISAGHEQAQAVAACTVMFGKKDVPSVPAVPPVDEKVAGIVATFKAVLDKVNNQLPWEAMRIVWFAMLDELAGPCKGDVALIITTLDEVRRLLEPWAITYSQSRANDVSNSPVSIKSYPNEPEASVKPVPDATVPDTGKNIQPPAQKGFHFQLTPTAPATASQQFPTIPKGMIETEVKNALSAEFDKMRGRVR